MNETLKEVLVVAIENIKTMPDSVQQIIIGQAQDAAQEIVNGMEVFDRAQFEENWGSDIQCLCNDSGYDIECLDLTQEQLNILKDGRLPTDIPYDTFVDLICLINEEININADHNRIDIEWDKETDLFVITDRLDIWN